MLMIWSTVRSTEGEKLKKISDTFSKISITKTGIAPVFLYMVTTFCFEKNNFFRNFLGHFRIDLLSLKKDRIGNLSLMQD